jgi:lipoprotein-anchoring transpeptidase ErfK/SrfK
MEKKLFSRRSFLEYSFFSTSGLLLLPLSYLADRVSEENVARVCTEQINIYSQPDRKSDVIMRRKRDELIQIYYEVQGDSGRNSLWYRVWGGYAHSAYLQRVKTLPCSALSSVSEDGVLAEVNVPYTQTYRQSRSEQWDLNYRLYYGSVHWVVGIEEGPNEQPWYLIKDSYERTYYACSEHLRPITVGELQPITPNVPREKKWIDVSISEQILTAYENDVVVLQTMISSGVPQLAPLEPGQIPSETPPGNYHITVKTPSRHMGDKELTGIIDTLALPGVPWVSFFHETGVSFHGTYWHSNFGVRMSHGCINMRNEDAKWIYRWAQPFIQPGERQASAWGTRVYVHA